VEAKLKGVMAVLVGTLLAAGCTDLLAPGAVLPPACADPAALLGTYDVRAPGYIVVFREGVDPEAETARLGAMHDFEPMYVYAAALRGFAALLSPQAVAAIRCESSVHYVEHDAVAMLGGL
jgi:hypothetical protein